MSSLRLEPASLLRDQQTVMQSRQSQLYSAKIRYKWLKVILHIVCAPFLFSRYSPFWWPSPVYRCRTSICPVPWTGQNWHIFKQLGTWGQRCGSWGPWNPYGKSYRAWYKAGDTYRFSQGQKQSSRGMLYKMSFSIHSTFAVYWKQTEFRARVELRCEQYNAISQIQPNGYVMSTDLNKLTGTGFYFQPAKSYQFLQSNGWWVANRAAGLLLLMGA